MGRVSISVALAAAAVLCACGGEEFSEVSGTGGSSSGGSGNTGGGATGGAAGSGGSAGATGGAGGATGGAAGSGGAGGSTGGAAGSGGAGGGNTGGAGGSTGGAGGNGGTPPAGCGNAHPSVAWLYTTLNDNAAVVNPAVIKNGNGQQTGGSFVEGICTSQGFRVSGPGHYLKFPAAQNINLVSGTLDFYFKPLFNKNDNQSHRLVGIPGLFQLVKGTQNDLSFGMGSTPLASVASANLPFAQNQWVRITVVWKTGATDITQIYFDGVAAPLAFAQTGPFTPPTLATESLWVGAFTTNDANHANGVFDDLKIYDGTEPP